MKSYYYFLLFFFVVCIDYSYGFLCWHCDDFDTADGATCSDPFFYNDPDLLKEECEGTCVKQIISDPNLPFKRYSRRCDITREKCRSGCSTSSGGVTTCEYCCQKKNLCNSAVSTTFSLGLMSAAVVLARMLYK